MKIKLHLIAEIDAKNVMVARRKLDAFREAVLPTQNYGVCLYENQSETTDTETRMRRALEQLATCDLNESNCASFEVANKRIHNLAKIALEG